MSTFVRVRIWVFAAAMATGLWAGECPAPDGLIVSSVEFQGLRHTRPGVVRQALNHHAGKAFFCRGWEEEKGRLKDLDVFAEVSLEASRSGDSLALVYRFQELPPYIPLISVNKTDQDGFSIGPQVVALNFLGTAKRVEVLARFLGTTEYQASISGRQLFGRPIEFDAAWIHVDSYNPFENFHEDSHRFKAEGFFPVTRTRRFGLEAMGEIFFIRSDTSGITLRSGGDWLPRLGVGLRFDGRDRALQPRRGVFAEGRFTQNGGPLGGPADYPETMGDLRAYIPMASRQGLVASVLVQYRGGGGMGRYDYFHVGGANTLRGFRDNALWGRSECLLNGEYRFDLLGEKVQRLGPWSVNYGLQLVAGADEAWLGNRMQDFESGVYAGVHLLVPGIERLRLEIGTNAAAFDVRFHFGLFEKTTAQRFRTR